MKWTVQTIEDTKKVAESLLASTHPIDVAQVVALSGDLGAGKTTFTQQLAELLGVSDTVTSPTFVIMKGYETTNDTWKQLIHIDAYRIDDIDEMRPLGFELLLQQPNTLVVIEWAERIAEVLPNNTIHLTFTHTAQHRTIECNDR